MVDWLEAQVTAIRQHTTPDDEGSHWSLFFDDPHGAPVIASAIDGAMNQMDDRLLHSIAQVLEEVPSPGCLLAVVRREGKPRPEDVRMWRDLRLLLTRDSDERLLGFVVVGESTYWSCDVGGDLCPAA